MGFLTIFFSHNKSLMDKIFFFVFFIVLSLFSSGCKNTSESTLNNNITINKKSQFNDTTVVLKNLAHDIKLIRLEANENCLISYFNGYVGDNNIISVNREKLLLFSGEGEFVKVISKRGRGPDEFTQIDAWDVDDDEKFLYYHDKGKNYIKKYNLIEKRFENDI